MAIAGSVLTVAVSAWRRTRRLAWDEGISPQNAAPKILYWTSTNLLDRTYNRYIDIAFSGVPLMRKQDMIHFWA